MSRWCLVGALAWLLFPVGFPAGLVRGEDLARPPSGVQPPGEPSERPDILGPLLDPINPSKLQRRLDEFLGLDAGDLSDKPEAPEIGEPVFFDVVRPLGDLKYVNELNYLLNTSTRNAPTLQILELEYVFADWKAAELDLLYYDGRLEVLSPFYQRTLGVGPRKNWVHGFQLSPDIYLRSRFVGGSAVYMLGWKPEPESRFSTLFFVGANRALIGGFAPPGLLGSPGRHFVPPGSGDRTFGAWRPLFNVNVFYKISEKLTFGVENDLFFHPGKAGEYLVLPFLTWKANEHAFFQVGGGYYHFENVDQATFMVHLNFVNPTTRKARRAEAGSRE